jgi:hypothetical protein
MCLSGYEASEMPQTNVGHSEYVETEAAIYQRNTPCGTFCAIRSNLGATRTSRSKADLQPPKPSAV